MFREISWHLNFSSANSVQVSQISILNNYSRHGRLPIFLSGTMKPDHVADNAGLLHITTHNPLLHYHNCQMTKPPSSLTWNKNSNWMETNIAPKNQPSSTNTDIKMAESMLIFTPDLCSCVALSVWQYTTQQDRTCNIYLFRHNQPLIVNFRNVNQVWGLANQITLC